MKKHIYLVLFLIGALFRVLFPDVIFFIKNKNENTEQKYCQNKNIIETYNNTKSFYYLDCRRYLLTKKYIEIINNVLSALLLGIPHFLNKMRNKDEEYKIRKQQTYFTNNQKINLIYNNNESSRISLTFKIIFIISTVDIFCQLSMPIKYLIESKYLGEIRGKDQNQLYALLFFDIFARYLFSRWILKTYFYIHHKLSFVLNIIGLILISLIDVIVKIGNDGSKYNLLYILVVSIQLIAYSFEDIMNKVAFRALSILPYTLIFYNGLIQLCYFIVISIFFFLFQLDGFGYFNWKKEIQNSICYLPFNIMRNYYLIKVIDTFSAQHMALLRITETSLIFIYYQFGELLEKTIFDVKPWQCSVQIIGFFFLIISSLIHNEIIIINHPKLKAKTQFYLDKDADKEQNESINTDTCFSDSGTNSVTNLYDDLTGSDMS